MQKYLWPDKTVQIYDLEKWSKKCYDLEFPSKNVRDLGQPLVIPFSVGWQSKWPLPSLLSWEMITDFIWDMHDNSCGMHVHDINKLNRRGGVGEEIVLNSLGTSEKPSEISRIFNMENGI